MFYLIALALAGTSPAIDANTQKPAPAGCAVSRPDACANTNDLVWSKGFERALKRFLGSHANDRVDLLFAKGRLLAQAREVLGGPPDDRQAIPGGGYLFTACRAHSCPEKGAVAIDASGRISALGTLTFHCGKAGQDCSDAPTLDLFVHGVRRTPRAESAILSWANSAVQASKEASHQPSLGAPILHDLDRRS